MGIAYFTVEVEDIESKDADLDSDVFGLDVLPFTCL